MWNCCKTPLIWTHCNQCDSQQLNYPLQLVNYYHYMISIASKQICSQYFAIVVLLLVLGISLALFFKISREVIPSWRSFFKKAKEKTFTCHGMKISKSEFATVALMAVIPLLFDWIPFTTNSYGQFTTWCWIHSLKQYCTTNSAGLWDRSGYGMFLTEL